MSEQTTLAEHPDWANLTVGQRKAVNRVWDDLVVPALEQVDRMREERDRALLEAQDGRTAYRWLLDAIENYRLWEPGKKGHADAHRTLMERAGLTTQSKEMDR